MTVGYVDVDVDDDGGDDGVAAQRRPFNDCKSSVLCIFAIRHILASCRHPHILRHWAACQGI